MQLIQAPNRVERLGPAGGYPSGCEFNGLLSDGDTIHVRPIRPDDAPRLKELHARLSPASVRRRFFAAHPVLSDDEARRYTTVDYNDRFALVCVVDDDLVAVARYERLKDPSRAEVAFVVEDRYQGRGAATLLLKHLAAAAGTRGIDVFVAETLFENVAMLAVFRDAGFPVEQTVEGDEILVTLRLR